MDKRHVVHVVLWGVRSCPAGRAGQVTKVTHGEYARLSWLVGWLARQRVCHQSTQTGDERSSKHPLPLPRLTGYHVIQPINKRLFRNMKDVGSSDESCTHAFQYTALLQDDLKTTPVQLLARQNAALIKL